MKVKIFTDKAPAPIGPYNQGIAASGKFLFISGQLPMDTKGQIIGSNITEQTEQALKNVGYILEEAGYTWADLVKTTVYLKDMGDFAGMNAVYQNFVKEEFPARAAFQVAKLPLDVMVEIEGVAVKD